MRVLSRHVIVEFLKPFFIGLASFTLLLSVGHLFEKLEMFVEYHAHPWNVAGYLLLRVPYWAAQVIPIATLLGVLFAVNRMVQQGELNALKSCGVHPFRVLIPLIVTTSVIAVGSFGFTETLLPQINEHAVRIYRGTIKHLPVGPKEEGKQLVMATGSMYRLTIDWFDARHGLMQGLIIDEIGKGAELQRQWVCSEARFLKNRWVGRQIVRRRFGPRGHQIIAEETMAETELPFTARPDEFLPDSRSPDEMSARELSRYLERLRRSGVPVGTAAMELATKLAYPWANVVVLFLGFPFAMQRSRTG
ncbi:MAG: LptF/LptG family permease, partial [Elusimicrobia bacterium]|nr:LptF/LptG family permease [Elusimicrobiota bacterium]